MNTNDSMITANDLVVAKSAWESATNMPFDAVAITAVLESFSKTSAKEPILQAIHAMEVCYRESGSIQWQIYIRELKKLL